MTTDKRSDLPLTYCERWNATLKRPIDVISAEEAAARYESGDLFSVVVGDVARPSALIEIRWETGYAAVWFFDDKVRRTLKYTFKRVEHDRLFLSGVTAWTFLEDAVGRQNEAIRLERITYREDGGVHREVKDKAADDTLVEDYADVDVVMHWEVVPEFGEWASLVRKGRETAGQ